MNYVECSEIEHDEDPDRDWRHAFEREVMAHETDMVEERRKGHPIPYEVDGETLYACDMDDDEIRRAAYLESVRWVEDAIRHHDEVSRITTKKKRGIAL